LADIDRTRRQHRALPLSQSEQELARYRPDEPEEPDEDPEIAPVHFAVHSDANDDVFPF
jgi:hypothetical protein